MWNFGALLFILLLSGMVVILCGSPPSPVRCDIPTGTCMLFNAYGTWPDRDFCRVGRVASPTSEQELIDTVGHGVKNNMKMKVVSKLAHSMPKLVCPGGNAGLLISTAAYASNVVVDRDSMTATVDSGVELEQLLEIIGNSGLALPSSPYWNGISIGGLLSTGSHGSSLWGKGSAVHEYVVGMRMIVPASPEEGYAKAINLTEADEDLNAAKVSLGVLGVISQVTLSLQPVFKRAVTNFLVSDANLEQQIVEFGERHEFGDVTWYPSKYEAIFRDDNRVPLDASGDGVNDFIGFQPTLVTSVETQRNLEETYEALGDSTGKCATALAETGTLFALGEGLKSSNGLFTGYPVVGFQHKIQSSGGCQSSASKDYVCPWDPSIRGLFYHQTTVSITVDRIQEFILDVKKLRGMNPTSFCGVDLYNGFLMRYVKGSNAYLGKQADSVDIDITYYRARERNTPRLDEDVLEEIEQIALIKYGGLPHWGKNRVIGFAGIPEKYPSLQKFLAVKNRLDPQGFFSSEWSDAVLGISGEVAKKLHHCALEGLCICSEDVHCAPEENYYCRPGKVFEEARVCRYIKNL